MIITRLWTELFGRRWRTAHDEIREKFATAANGVTVLRAAVAGALLVSATITQSYGLLLAGLATSMFFDFADGQIARRGKPSTTVLGAQLDGLADRLAVFLVALGVISMNHEPSTVLAAGAVWLQFGILDHYLASQFLRFGLWSPDHFYCIDEGVWRRNWSPAAKLASNLPVLLLALGSSSTWGALALSSFLISTRIPSVMTIRRLARELPEQRLCMTPPAGQRVVVNDEAPQAARSANLGTYHGPPPVPLS